MSYRFNVSRAENAVGDDLGEILSKVLLCNLWLASVTKVAHEKHTRIIVMGQADSEASLDAFVEETMQPSLEDGNALHGNASQSGVWHWSKNKAESWRLAMPLASMPAPLTHVSPVACHEEVIRVRK